MGEYASYDGEEIKIGTCEDMYYLRYDQRHAVGWLPDNVDPVKDAEHLRYRFPWPSEDGKAPGTFDSAYKQVCIHGLSLPAEVEHSSVQFVAQAGYNVCLPCPESSAYTDESASTLSARTWQGLRVHRNGFRGRVLLVAQRYRPDTDRLVPVFQCGGCGRMFRSEDDSYIEEAAMHCRSEADRRENANDARYGGNGQAFWNGVADRLLAGAKLLSTVA